MTRTYLDACVLFWAWRGEQANALKALAIMNDPAREYVSGIFLMLEALPKATCYKNADELALYQAYLDSCVETVEASRDLCRDALEEAKLHGLGALDALHVASAIAARADELVTAEAVTKPIHKVTRVRVVSIA